jgi:uncharacterized membrane protein
MKGQQIALRRGVGFVFLGFAIGGIAHFAATNTEMRIVPLTFLGRAQSF